MSAPVHPAHLIWALWTDNDTGQIVLTNREGEVFHLDPAESCHLAAMLAGHCTDNDDRWFVRSEWGEIEPDDEDDEPTGRTLDLGEGPWSPHNFIVEAASDGKDGAS